MDITILRNKRQALEFTERLMQMRLPLKVATQSIYPLRSIEANNYYRGVVIKAIADSCGHDPEEVHQAYRRLFCFKYDMKYNEVEDRYEWICETQSTTEMDTKEIWDYILKVRADGELNHRVTIELPNELFINELDFDHDKIEKHRI